MENTATLQKEENKLIQIEDISAEMLPELHGWKEKQLQIVKENPFISIEDNKTYEEAKKNRTALVTARTTIEKQEKLIASKLKDFRNKVGEASKELIAITSPHEEKQQEEVREYEAKKEAERLEKERIEQARKDAILKGINDWYAVWQKNITELTFDKIELLNTAFEKAIEERKEIDVEEFDMIYAEKLQSLQNQIAYKIDFITKEETARVERVKLEAERREFELQQQAAKEKADKEEADRKAKEEKERAQREAEAKKIQDQQKAEAEKLAKERAELESEKQKIADAKAKEEAEIEAKKQAEIQAQKDAETKKRIEALKPDKDKLNSFINSLDFTQELPELHDPSSKDFLTEMLKVVKDLKEAMLKDADELK